MERRTFLAAAGAGVASAGCIGGGSDVVANVQREVRIGPGDGWIEEVPDVPENGGAVSYVTRARRPFDVYFFTSERAVERYRAFLKGDDPAETPTGDRELGRTATEAGDGYKAASENDGGRQPIEATGPYYFVVDHSAYPAAGGAYPEDPPAARSVFVDLTVTRKRFGI